MYGDTFDTRAELLKINAKVINVSSFKNNKIVKMFKTYSLKASGSTGWMAIGLLLQIRQRGRAELLVPAQLPHDGGDFGDVLWKIRNGQVQDQINLLTLKIWVKKRPKRKQTADSLVRVRVFSQQ